MLPEFISTFHKIHNWYQNKIRTTLTSITVVLSSINLTSLILKIPVITILVLQSIFLVVKELFARLNISNNVFMAVN